ncbi:MAG: ferritin-like domain-containing protein [Bacillota bacterium]|nr:ferritin-like domain-containing protein [Bacillota bacterium]
MDKARQAVIDNLNNVLTGENMAIKTYERFLKKLPESIEKAQLVEFYKDHQRHAKELTDRVQQLGGRPSKGVGVIGIMAVNRIKLQTMLVPDLKDIIQNLCHGEKMGITVTQEMVKGDLDATSLELVKDILAQDLKHVEKLETMLH